MKYYYIKPNIRRPASRRLYTEDKELNSLICLRSGKQEEEEDRLPGIIYCRIVFGGKGNETETEDEGRRRRLKPRLAASRKMSRGRGEARSMAKIKHNKTHD